MEAGLVLLFDNKGTKCDVVADAAQGWRKSSRSMTNGNCVEVSTLSGEFVGVRDSMNPQGAILGITRSGWSAFLGGVRSSQFDRRGL
jgi:uncharacterized protein DUF397